MEHAEIAATAFASTISATLSLVVGYFIYRIQKNDKRREEEHRRQEVERKKEEEKRRQEEERKAKDQAETNKAIKDAVQCILRDRLIHLINKSVEEGQAPVFTVENVNKMYESYHTLEGNGTIDQLYEHFRDLPTREPPKKESVIEVHAG